MYLTYHPLLVIPFDLVGFSQHNSCYLSENQVTGSSTRLKLKMYHVNMVAITWPSALVAKYMCKFMQLYSCGSYKLGNSSLYIF